jgi:phenylpropionate dioxygenase-like ring-hydroxylating dioxygenase large terminal subunit
VFHIVNTTKESCNYQLLVDNLMDLSHETYVHPSSIGQHEIVEAPIKAISDDTSVTVTRWMHDIVPPPFLGGESQVHRKVRSLADLRKKVSFGLDGASTPLMAFDDLAPLAQVSDGLGREAVECRHGHF